MVRISWTRFLVSREKLIRTRTVAIRKGVWYKAIDRAERGLVELTIRIVKRIGSLLLKKVLASILRKLQTAMENRITYLARKVGKPLAEKLSSIARSWGSVSAVHWKSDQSFAKFLAVMQMNAPRMFRDRCATP